MYHEQQSFANAAKSFIGSGNAPCCDVLMAAWPEGFLISCLNAQAHTLLDTLLTRHPTLVTTLMKPGMIQPLMYAVDTLAVECVKVLLRHHAPQHP